MEENEDIMIKCKVRLSKQMFPKDKLIGNGDFGIISVTVLDILQGEPQTNKWNCIVLIGTKWCNEINDDEIYIVTGKEIEHEKFGLQYQVIFMCTDIKLTNKEDQYKFLEKILPEKQCIELFKTFENPIEVLEGKDIKALCTVKGIGVPTAIKLIEKYENSKDYSEAYVKLDKYGLSNNTIEKLVDFYGSPNTVITKIEENPYILIDEVDGIGWEKADEMALNSGLGEYSINRVKAYVKYYLHQEAYIGNTWVDIDDLLDAVDGTIGCELPQETLTQALHEMKNQNIIWTSENQDKIGLMKYYRLEENITEELKRLNEAENHFNFVGWEEKIKKLEQRQNWEFTLEQIEGIKAILENQVVMITGSAGSVDCDTEYFNGVEWVKISNYKESDKVLQYNKNGNSELVNPLKYHKYPADYLWHFETRGIDQCLCDEHTIIYKNYKNNIIKTNMSDMIEKHNKKKNGFNGKFITTFNYSGNGIELTDNEIRLMVCIHADGSFHDTTSTNRCRLCFSKVRKINRSLELLNNCNIDYNITEKDNLTYIYFNAPRRSKIFDGYWYNCSNHQLRIITDEYKYWDSSSPKNTLSRFITTEKESADFMQFAFSACGIRATMYIDDRYNKLCYCVLPTNNTYITIVNPHTKTPIIKYKTLDGYKYCFTVPSGMLVLRRNNKIFITGNCGKSSTVAGELEIFKEFYSFIQTALSGRASCNLSEITGEDGYTIHRALGYTPEKGFIYNKNNKLPVKIIIHDEISMDGADIFYKLIQAIETGSKLIMLGDEHQLESIGVGNIMFDMIQSGYIKIVKLTKIHRQAEKSAIITESIKIRNQEQIIDKDFTGVEIRGELQDLKLDIYKDKNNTHTKVIEHFKELLPKTESIFDIQVIVPMKERGKASAYQLNNSLQEIVIDTKNKKGLVVGENSKYPFTIYIGDKVLNNKNNYKTVNEYGDEIPIFNGDLGIVVDIDYIRNTLIVNFNNKGNIYISKSHLPKITLGYAMTCHKCIPKDTYILTSNGLDTMEDYIDIEKIGTYNYTHNDNIYNGLKMEKPSLIHNVGMSQCKEIITNNGYSLTATLDHGIDVISEDGYIIRKDIQDLTTKDQVIIAQNTNIFGDIVKIPDTYFKYDLDVRSVRYNKPKILDEKLSMLLGMIVADGTIRHAHICYGKTNREVVEVFTSLAKDIFNYEINIRYDNIGNIYLAEINSTDIVAFLMNFGGLKPNNKAIPKLIKQTSKNNICSFLKGMFEDGGVHLKKGIFDMIELTQSNNKKLITEIQLLLLNLGILSSIKEYKKYGKNSYLNTPTNKLFIYRKDAIKFNELIGFIAYHKQEALQLAYINTKPSERNSIKNISKVILKIMNNHKLSIDKKFKMRLNSSISRNGITKYMLNTFLSYCNNIYNDKNIEYLKYLNDNCLIQNISQINDKGEIECYCFTMPESGKFIQNGFRGFNCQGSGIKYVIAALDYSHYKLLTKEMVYTMLTRAKEYCVLCAENKALRYAIKQTSVSTKQTHLKDMLIKCLN